MTGECFITSMKHRLVFLQQSSDLGSYDSGAGELRIDPAIGGDVLLTTVGHEIGEVLVQWHEGIVPKEIKELVCDFCGQAVVASQYLAGTREAALRNFARLKKEQKSE
jgi:hypothetical protein